MIKFLKGCIKLIEGMLFLFLPVVVFYWALTLVNLDVIKPFVAILGAIINPLMEPFRGYLEYVVNYDSFAVDYTILFFAGMILFCGIILAIVGKILDFIEQMIYKIQASIQVKERIRKKEEEKQKFINEVSKNNTIYVTLKLIKNEPTEAYLVKDMGDDFFSVGLVDSYETSLTSVYKKFAGKLHGNNGGPVHLNNYIFYDVDKFLEFLPYFINRVEEVNKGMLDLNIKFDYKIACHCSYSDASAEIDVDITSKILNLCGNREILLSELLKNRLEVLENNNIKLFSRGIYLIKDKQMDVFKLQLD